MACTTPAFFADDTAIAGRIGQFDGKQAQLIVTDQRQQTLQGSRFDQRHIAIENQHGLGAELRQRLSHGMPGAQLLGLDDEIQVIGGQALTYGVGAMADHHLDALRLQAACGIDDMPEHGLVGDRMQHLGQSRTHARALAGGQNDDIQTHRKLLAGQELDRGGKEPQTKSAILPETQRGDLSRPFA